MAEVRVETLNHPVPQPWGDTLSRRRIGFVIAAVMLGMLLSALDQTVVGTAMPRIIASLDGLQHYAWVATGYLLASTASMPIWGKLSDAYGRKRFYIIGMALFVVGSVLCGQSHSMTELILFRAFQGLGAGAMMPIAQAIIGDGRLAEFVNRALDPLIAKQGFGETALLTQWETIVGAQSKSRFERTFAPYLGA